MQESNTKNQELKENHVKMNSDCSKLVVACEKVEERNVESTKQMSCCRQHGAKTKKETEQMIEKLGSNGTIT